jgi:hypothetical protein
MVSIHSQKCLPMEEAIARIAQTISILCNVPKEDIRPLAFEYYNLNKNERIKWETLENWLLAKGYNKSSINIESEVIL